MDGTVTDSSDKLSPLQRALVDAFFRQTDRFFLTGGGALAGFYLHHRVTDDLDLFATGDVEAQEGVYALRAAANDVGATAQLQRHSGDFNRFVVTRGDETTLVDVVIDRAPQIVGEKPRIGHVRIDPPREIAANKLCAILGRAAPRDLVDLKLLLDGGMRLEDVIEDARVKDGGADPATLAWVLSEIRISPDAAFPAGVDGATLDTWRSDLIVRLRRMALPSE